MAPAARQFENRFPRSILCLSPDVLPFGPPSLQRGRQATSCSRGLHCREPAALPPDRAPLPGPSLPQRPFSTLQTLFPLLPSARPLPCRASRAGGSPTSYVGGRYSLEQHYTSPH